MEQYHPSTLTEMVDILEQTLSPEALADLRNIEEEQSLSKLQFGLGLYIRNHLIHQNDNKIALYENFHKEHPTLVDPLHSEADDVSRLAIMRLWERLRAVA